MAAPERATVLGPMRDSANQRPSGHRSSEYSSWHDMVTRCTNPNYHSWSRYGGRGITICNRWRLFPRHFEQDLGRRPPGCTLDRINTNGHYSCGKCLECVANGWPMNCKWSTRKEQVRNRSNNRMITHNGKTMCVASWEEVLGFPTGCLRKRISQLGWPVDRAMTEGVHRDMQEAARTGWRERASNS